MQLSLFPVLLIWTFLMKSRASANALVHILTPGQIFKSNYASTSTEFHILCYKGQSKRLSNIWQSIILKLNHAGDSINVYEGSNPEEVEKEYSRQHSFWSFNIFSSNHKTFELHPFYTNCFGIETSETYSAHIDVIRIDFWKLLLLLFGVLTFLTADKMSRNNIFHYICGITLGMSASILILVYFVSRIFPKKSFMYGILGCGWTVAIYGLQLLWGNLQSILVLYKFYIIWYIIATGLVSFIACYRWGPVVNPRTLNLIRWLLQLLGLFSIFNSTQYHEAAMVQIFILLICYNFPHTWISNCKTYWRRRSPPKIKLLTEEEYYQQGVEETSKALNELRKYCSSPECNQWKTVRKLKDVKKFASFIEGDSHVTEEEIFDYESSLTTFIEGGDILDEDD